MNYSNNTDDVFQRARRAIINSVLALLTVIAIGTVGYKELSGPDISWIDAMYMTFLMVATIGYGSGIELFHHPDRELFTMAIAFSGIGIVTYLFSSVTALMLASDFDKAMRRRAMEKQMQKLEGHYILCGFGRVGRNVADELDLTNHHHIVIEESLELLESAVEGKRGMHYIHGDASDDDVLIKANISKAKGVFAVTGDDSRNLMIALTARQLNPSTRVVARCNDLRNVEKMKKAGADAIVSPSFTGGMRIASAMLRPQVVSFLDEMLRSEQHLRVEEVTASTLFKSCMLSELITHRSDQYVLLAVRTGADWVFNPPGSFVVQPGFTLIAMASPQGRQELKQCLQIASSDEA
jgi:voltage-gated potassium channel